MLDRIVRKDKLDFLVNYYNRWTLGNKLTEDDVQVFNSIIIDTVGVSGLKLVKKRALAKIDKLRRNNEIAN